MWCLVKLQKNGQLVLPGTRLVLRLRQQPELLPTLRVSSCLVVSADIVYRSGIMSVTAEGVNGYPAEPKASMVSAVDFTLRRLATYLLHGEPLSWWCCRGAAEVVATSLVPQQPACRVWLGVPGTLEGTTSAPRAELHPGHALSPGHTPDLLVR